MNPATVVVPALAGLSLFLVFWGLSRGIGGDTQAIDERLGRYASRSGEFDKQKAAAEISSSPIAAQLDKALAGRGFTERTARDLARADLKLTVSEFVVVNLLAVVVGALLGILISRSMLIGILGAIVGFYLPRFYVKQRRGARLNRFNDQLGDSINLMVNGLRSGYSQMQAMETVSREMPPPSSIEFGRVVREVGLGLSLDQALDNMFRRLESEDLDLMITAIKVQHEVGGNLAEILDTISFTIRERVRLQGEIRVLTSMQMISAYILSFLPVGLGVIVYIMSPKYMGQMLQEVCGWIMLGVAVTIVFVGFLVIRKIVAIEV